MKSGRLIDWFIKLRWFAFAGQAVILLLALQVFNLTLPWQNIALILSIIPFSNLLVSRKIFPALAEEYKLGSLLILDTILLTAVLHQSGGSMNPFSIVYLVHVVLSAVMLPAVWSWSLAGFTSLCFGFLFLSSKAVPEWDHHGMHHGFSLHLHGMLFSYVLVAFLAAYFVGKISEELRKKERELERLENIRRSQQRLASLTAFSADAAHQLGTPLGTIALVAHEMEKDLEVVENLPENIRSEIELLKKETQRCKKILQTMAERTGEVHGEMPEKVNMEKFIDSIVRDIGSKFHDRLFKLSIGIDEAYIPRRAMDIALRAIIKNAFESCEPHKEVALNINTEGSQLVFSVIDQGKGMSAEVLSRVGEPFFSTKLEGRGFGLGVYVAKLITEQLGGELSIYSELNKGTIISLSIPMGIDFLNREAA